MDAAVFVQQAFGLAILLAVPLALAAIVGSAVGSMVSMLTGLSDPALAVVLRAVAVVLAAVLGLGVAVQETRALTGQAWSKLTELGQGSG